MTTLRMNFANIFAPQKRNLLILALFSGLTMLVSLLISFQGPIVGIGALVVFILFLVALAWPETATLFFAFALYTNMLGIATKHGVPNIVAASFVLILVIPLTTYIIVKRQPIVVTPTLFLLLAHIGVMVLSALVTGNVAASVTWIQTFLTEGLLLYLLVTNVIRSSAMLHRIIWMVILAGIFMGGLSLFQELTHTYSNNYWGFAQTDKGGFKVGEDLSGSVYHLRMSGPIGEKNRYGQIMLVLFPIAFFRFWLEKSRVLKIAALIGTALILCGVLLSFSRGAAVAMVGLLVIMTFWGYIKVRQVIVILATLLALIAIVVPSYILRLDSLQGVAGLFSDDTDSADVGPDGAIVGRATSNLAALNTFMEHPILGVGPGQYFEQYSQNIANTLGLRFFNTARRAHNLYLETAADLGIIGLGTMMAILLTTVFQLHKARKYWVTRNTENANIISTFILSMLAFMATSVFLHLSYLRYFTLLLALANSAIYVLNREAKLGEDELPAQNEQIQAIPVGGEASLAV